MKKSFYILIIAIICITNLIADDLSNINQEFFNPVINDEGLVIQGMDWGRINLFDLPLVSQNQGEGQAITVTNLAEGDQADIRLKDFTIKSSLNLESLNAFYFDEAKTENLTAAAAKNKFNGIVIAKNAKSPTSVVYFGPATTGDYQIEYGISGEAVANTAIKFGDGVADKYTLKGTVFVPNIHLTTQVGTIVDQLNFVKPEIPNKAPNQFVYIGNTNFKNEARFGGQVTFNLEFNNISVGGPTPFKIVNSKIAGFYYDLTNLNDLKLGYGETIELEISYDNALESKDQATIMITKDDADQSGNTGFYSTLITLNGVSSFSGPRAWVDDIKFDKYIINPDSTQNNAKQRKFKVINKCLETNEDGKVNLKIVGFDGPFSGVFAPVNLPTNFEVAKGIPQEFSLQFLPTEPGEYKDSIVFIADQGEVLCDLVCKIEAVAEMLSSVKETLNLKNPRIIPSPVIDESSVLDFNLIQSGKVTIRICDLVGNCLFILNDEYLNNGSHKFNIPINKLVAGVYVYEIIYQNEIISDKFEVVK